MFKAARLKLTVYYLIIIMIICTLFSLVIYAMFSFELARSLRMQSFRTPIHEGMPLQFDQFTPMRPRPIDEEILYAARRRMVINLISTNFVILVISTAAAYFLAGRTLKPIEAILEEHKRFTGDASHELRTPLTALRTSIEVTLRDKNLDLTEAKAMLESNLEEVNKLQYLSEHLLTLNRFDTIRQAQHAEPVKLFEAYEAAVNHTRVKAELKDINIVFTGDQEMVVEGFRDSLMQLLIIFIDNAIKYSHEYSQVNVNIEPARNAAIIKVTDSGIGIASKDIRYIFNRFYRADSSRLKNEPGGYGLGLSIAQKIIELHHGSVSVDSQPGQGTTFIVKLPFRQKIRIF